MGRPKGSRNGEYTLVDRTCARCEAVFRVMPSAAGKRYCSQACYRPPRALVACRGCGVQYLPSTSTMGVYCSNACKRRRVEKECPGCGRRFSVRVSKAARFTHCSVGCKPDLGIDKSCETCGVPMRQTPSTIGRKYCSTACAVAPHRAVIACAYCGRERTVKKYRVAAGARFCNNTCGSKYYAERGFVFGSFADKLRSGYRTDIEAMAEAALRALGIEYAFEKRIGRRTVDFYLPLMRVALECDGWHHGTERGRAKDAVRDAELRARGVTPVHIVDADLRRDALRAVSEALGVRADSAQVEMAVPA